MLKSNSIKYYALIGLLLLIPLSSCSPKYKATKAQRQAEKVQEKRRKEGERAMRQGREQHLRAQSKQTQKRMKETRRRSESLNNNRKKPFYIRWVDAVRGRR